MQIAVLWNPKSGDLSTKYGRIITHGSDVVLKDGQHVLFKKRTGQEGQIFYTLELWTPKEKENQNPAAAGANDDIPF